ncbi:MAG: PBP1A family penicillin-binding protein [bacterium]|nr:PBP1A family penicillin-binding protein [bacterium]
MKLAKKTIKLGIFFSILGILTLISLYVVAYFSPVLDIKSTGQYYIYDNDNNLVFQGSGNAKWVNLEDVSPYFIDAIISTEDKNFYKHNGFDYLRILKTLFLNFKTRSIVGGASTISQQYVKNLYLDFDKTWERKLEEAWLTLKLEVHYDKDDILEGYINTINFGQGNFGIENAANYYFNKSAKNLTLEESIILSGIPKGPSYYNPVSNYDNAIKRANVVAKAMVNNKKISEDTKNNLFQNKIEIYGKRTENNLDTIMYYQDLVIKELESISAIPTSLIETGGLKIYTSFDLKLQTLLENSINNNIKDDLQVASVVIDPKTGNIMALTGGKNYAESQYNRASVMKRQVGSTMKPLLYYAALENGMTSTSTFLSQETTFVFSNNETYSPQNYNQRYGNKDITMAAALSYSDNIYAVKTHLFLGTDALVNISKRMGINEYLPNIASLPLGTVELYMLDFANAYTTLASGGYKKDLSFIRKVTDINGNILYEKKDNSTQVLNESYTYILNELLTSTYSSAFKDYNTPTIIGLASKISRKYAMKTGSTGTDCWMIGYNPDILMMVWNGYDDNKELNGTHSKINKNIWVETVEEYVKDKEAHWYEKPENVVGIPRDAVTGGEVTDINKSFVYYYVKGSEIVVSNESKENE